MENYKFKIREFKEKTIEIEGKNSDEEYWEKFYK